MDRTDLAEVLRYIQTQAATHCFRVSLHAHQEMVEEGILLDDVLQALQNGQILENYPDHRRGACCLVYGITHTGSPLHVVCTSERSVMIIITVYLPLPPKWITPTERRSPQ